MASSELFHLSEDGQIERFVPRPAPSVQTGLTGEMVWAVDAAHLQNYLFPRDCPRVTFYALPNSDPADVYRLLGASGARAVVAIETRWFPILCRSQLYCYTFDARGFTVWDSGAGYFISREVVIPTAVERIDDLPGALLQCNVELRVMPSLWRLRDAVLASTLQFSFIRMRNALPR